MAESPLHPPALKDGMGAVRPWRLYDVQVDWRGERHTTQVAGASPASARYRHYLHIADVFPDLTFRRFQGMCRVRLAGRAADPDAYAYIGRAYGLDVAHGDRVSIRNEGAEAEGKEGAVVHPNGSINYVHVVIDGESHVSLFHPDSLVKLSVPPHPTTECAVPAHGGRG